MAKQPVDTSAV